MGMHRRSQHLLISGVDGVGSLDPPLVAAIRMALSQTAAG